MIYYTKEIECVHKGEELRASEVARLGLPTIRWYECKAGEVGRSKCGGTKNGLPGIVRMCQCNDLCTQFKID